MSPKSGLGWLTQLSSRLLVGRGTGFWLSPAPGQRALLAHFVDPVSYRLNMKDCRVPSRDSELAVRFPATH